MTHLGCGIALAGGGPLGAIYEIGVLAALHETLDGLDLNGCDVYVGISSGSFLAAGLANGLSVPEIHGMFIESDTAADPFDPKFLLRPAFGEYAGRLASVGPLLLSSLQSYFRRPGEHGFFEAFLQLGRALPAGLFDNAGIATLLDRLFSRPGCTNDFRELRHKLLLVATDLDSGKSVAFGEPGWDDVPISRAVQASAALPLLFPPVEIDGRWYVDGVLNRTVHASLALKEGVKLLICVNPLVPFDADLAAPHTRHPPLTKGGLPVVLSQTFRAIIHSRMVIGMERYAHEYPDADIVLFEPGRDDAELFFTNVFSYSDRRRLCEHAYQHTRAELRRRSAELEPVLARHGIRLDHAVLDDRHRRLESGGRHPASGTAAVARLGRTLDRLQRVLDDRYGADGAPRP